MLGKLTKYEIKATARQFLPLYGALVVMSIIMRVFFGFRFYPDSFNSSPFGGSELPIVLSMMVYFALIVAIAVVTLVVMLQRFYKNLLGDEGYLMFTLPVRTWELIVSKLITTFLWGLASGVVMALTIFILAFNTGMISIIQEGFQEILSYSDPYIIANMGLIIAELTVSMIISAVSSILMVYAAISLGHLFNKHRVLASFGAYLAINMAMSTVSSLFGTMFSGSLMNSINVINFSGVDAFRYAMQAMIPAIIISILFCAGLFFLTNYLLSHKLNLE